MRIRDGACTKCMRRLLFCAELPEAPVKRSLRQSGGIQAETADTRVPAIFTCMPKTTTRQVV